VGVYPRTAAEKIKMAAVIHQAYFLPWLGYFSKLAFADTFIVLDDVFFRKRFHHDRTEIVDTSRIPLVIMLTGDGPKGTKSLSWANLPPRLASRGIASFLFDFEGLGISDGVRARLTLTKGIQNFLAAFTLLRWHKIGLMFVQEEVEKINQASHH
jgi:hypothetical protein